MQIVHPIELWLDIPANVLQQAWQASQKYFHRHQRWTAYLNQIALKTLGNYLQQEQNFSIGVWPSQKSLPTFWGIVEGTMIELDITRILLLPSENLDQDELRVPQEWVDILSWRPDYYLSIHVDLDEQLVGIGVHCSHQQLKTHGDYQPDDRTYTIASEYLDNDFNVLLVSLQLGLKEVTQADIAPLAPIPSIQAENLLKRLSNRENLLPRLTVPFSLWGGLLQEPSYREQLYQLYQGQELQLNPRTRLASWLENICGNEWQSLDNLNLALAGRRSGVEQEIKRAKIITIDSEHTVIVLVSIRPETDDRISISLQLFPQVEQRYLPTEIQLQLCDENAAILQILQASSQDNYLQIRRFKASRGLIFQVHVILKESRHIETFVV